MEFAGRLEHHLHLRADGVGVGDGVGVVRPRSGAASRRAAELSPFVAYLELHGVAAYIPVKADVQALRGVVNEGART